MKWFKKNWPVVAIILAVFAGIVVCGIYPDPNVGEGGCPKCSPCGERTPLKATLASVQLRKKAQLPLDMPPCNEDTYKHNQVLTGAMGSQDEVILCLKNRDRLFAWRVIYTRELK